MSLIVFILILSILIVVHEWGHFITATKSGVKVEQFSIGFGPRLWGWVHDGCEFCVCAIPLGGFVKMAGDERDKCTGKSGEFFGKSIGIRSRIVLMGPVVNYILAYVCFWLVFVIGYVDMPPVLGEILEHSPAKEAGLQVQDRIVSINGQAITHWSQVHDLISNSTGNMLILKIERDHQQITIGVKPEEAMKEDIFGRQHKQLRIGVGPSGVKDAKDIVIIRYGFLKSFRKAAEELWSITVTTCVALYEMAIGTRSPKEAMGPVGMYFVIKYALAAGFSVLLHIVGIISASLAIFNVLPVVPLDGGHLFLFGLEKIRGKALSIKTDQWIARAGFTLIIMLALFVFYSDFERVGWIDKMVKLFKATGL